MEDVSKRNKARDLSYEEFCRPEAGGTNAFSYNLVDLSPKENPKDSNHDLGKLYRDTTKILRKIKQTIKEVEDGRKRKIKQYYIGKTYAHKDTSQPEVFDHMNKNTWLKKGIIDRCTHHSKKSYGKGGSVVLTAIPESRIPKQTRLSKLKTHEDYALALEQQVINHLVFEKADTRVFNQTSNEGKRQMKDTEETDEQPKEKEHKNADAFLIYMAFSCEGDDEHGITQTTSQEENPVCEKPIKSTRKRSPNTSPSYEKEVPVIKRKNQNPDLLTSNMSVMSHDGKSRQLDISKVSHDDKPKSHDKTLRPSHKPKMSHDRTSRSLDKYEMTHEIPRHSHRDKPTFSKLSDNYRQRDSDKTEENQVDLRHPGNKNKTHTMSNDKKPHPSRKTSFIEPDSMNTQGKNKELIKKSIEHQKRETHLK